MSSTPNGERRPLDAYYTPDALALALVNVLPLSSRATVLEPSAGGGAFARALLDRVRWLSVCDIDPDAPGLALGDARHVGDFLDFLDFDAHCFDWVIGNPPFRGFEAHVDHALSLAPNVAFLLRLAAMETAGRIDCWKRWPLRKVWVLAERPSFTGGGTDSCAYGWFWFSTASTGPAEIVPGWSWR